MARPKRSCSSWGMPRVEVGDGVVAVEDAHDHRLAVDGGQGDHADVDGAAVDGHPHAAVLGQPPLGDVQLSHDLGPGDDAADHPAGDRGGGGENAVHAKAHAQLPPVGFEVDVRGPLLDRLGDDRVEQLDDGGVLGGLLQVDDLAGLALLLGDVGGRSLDDVVQAGEPRDQRGDAFAGRDRRAHLHAGHQGDVVDGQDVGRVGHGDQQRALVQEGRGGRRSAWPPTTRSGSPPPRRP